MDEKKELKKFMKKKNMEARGEANVEVDEVEDKLKDAPRSVYQESGEGDMRSAKALTVLRMVLNLMFIIPIALISIGLIVYILLKFLPSVVQFVRNLIFMLFTQ